MSIPPGTPSEGEGEGALSKKKNRPLSIDWLGVQTVKFFSKPYKFLKWGLGAQRSARKWIIGPNPWRIVCRARRTSWRA